MIDTNIQGEIAQVKQTENDKTVPIEIKDNSNINETDNQVVGRENAGIGGVLKEVGDELSKNRNKKGNMDKNDNNL